METTTKKKALGELRNISGLLCVSLPPLPLQKMCANLHMIGRIRTKAPILNRTPGMRDNDSRGRESEACADLKRAVCDVVDVHGEDVVFAAHVHPVLVLVHMQDPVVHGLVWYGVVFEGLGRLQVWDTHTERKKKERRLRGNIQISLFLRRVESGFPPLSAKLDSRDTPNKHLYPPTPLPPLITLGF